MKPEIVFYGQSCFHLKDKKNSIVIDPGNKRAGTIKGNIGIITHNHFDHMNGISSLVKYNPESIVICNNNTAKSLKIRKETISILHVGESIEINGWNFTSHKFRHGLFKGVLNTGYLIRTSEITFGHLGDAVEFSSFYNEKIDILAVPISGLFTASPTKVIREFNKFQILPTTVILMHWLFRNPKKFAVKLMEHFPRLNCIAPTIGVSIPF